MAGAASPMAPAAPPAPPTEEEAGAIMRSGVMSKFISPDDAARIKAALGPNGEAAFQEWAGKHGIQVGQSPALPALHEVLPPRTDGLEINQGALQRLFALDPQGASQIQSFVHNSNKQQLEEAASRGEAMALAAKSWRKMPFVQREQARREWTPFLMERGYHQSQIDSADLSDASLDRMYSQGLTIAQIVAADNADRSFAATQAERAIDNQRADRAAARADIASERAGVRFNERDKDRAAMAGGNYEYRMGPNGTLQRRKVQ